MSLGLNTAIAGVPIALLEGSLVVLPKQGAFNRLAKLRAPGWAAVLPGSIVAGTFGPLMIAPMSGGLVVLAAITAPPLALLAAAKAIRRPLLLIGALLVACSAALSLATAGQLAVSMTTALACLCCGIALERLIPRGWLSIAVVAMAVVDVAFFWTGLANRPTTLMAAAQRRFGDADLGAAQIGGIGIGYPDLVLAGLLGSAVAGDALRRYAAALVVLLAVALDVILGLRTMTPATPPLAITLVVIDAVRARRHQKRVDHVCGGIIGTPGHASDNEPPQLLRLSADREDLDALGHDI